MRILFLFLIVASVLCNVWGWQQSFRASLARVRGTDLLKMSSTMAPPKATSASSSSGGNGKKSVKGSKVGALLAPEAFAKLSLGSRLSGRVVSTKSFGCFVDIGETSVLLPRSVLSRGAYDRLSAMANSKSTEAIEIEIIGLNTEQQTLSAKYIPSDAEKLLDERGNNKKGTNSDFEKIPNKRWVQGVVESVTNFGIFVRPAGIDATGLVHNSRVPRELIAALKMRASPGNDVTATATATSAPKTEVEVLFSKGDVVRVRVNSFNSENGRAELSMLKFRASEEDEDDYVVEGRDPEDEEGNFKLAGEQRDQEDDYDHYDAQDTLLWWRGAPYAKNSVLNAAAAAVDEEVEVVMESSAVVEGTWRRMFEVDMREDQADFSTKVREADLKELEEEIGELGGLDEDLMLDFDGMSAVGAGAREFRVSSHASRLGNHVASSSVPPSWQSDVAFFRSVNEAEMAKLTALRRGKPSEQSEFETLLREVEAELEVSAAAARGGAGAGAGAGAGPGSFSAASDAGETTESA